MKVNHKAQYQQSDEHDEWLQFWVNPFVRLNRMPHPAIVVRVALMKLGIMER